MELKKNFFLTATLMFQMVLFRLGPMPSLKKTEPKLSHMPSPTDISLTEGSYAHLHLTLHYRELIQS